MEKINRYIQGTINTNGCNLNCDYCYLKLQGRNSKGAEMNYSIQHIQKAMKKERWGRCFISLTGDGETLGDSTTVDLSYALLSEGHFLNIINNGTMTSNLEYMANLFPEEYKKHTMLTFSLHYIELKNRGLLDVYYNNIRMMKNNGFTIYLHLVLADNYVEIADEIKDRCKQELGIWPQIGIVRAEQNENDRSILSKYSDEEYFEVANSFMSPYFELQRELYLDRNKTEYCYAGELGVLLNFSTGIMRQCLSNLRGYNVFEDINSPIHFLPVGKTCNAPWCFCAPFQILGMKPYKSYKTYSDIYSGDYKELVSEEMKYALDVKLADEYLKGK